MSDVRISGLETSLRGMTSAYDRVVAEKHELEGALRERLAGAGVGLSSSDRVRLQSIIDLLRKQPVCWDMESALLERLLASQTATWVCPAQSNECAIRQKCTNKCGRNDYQHLADLHSAICALLDSDVPAGDLRKALAELVGRR